MPAPPWAPSTRRPSGQRGRWLPWRPRERPPDLLAGPGQESLALGAGGGLAGIAHGNVFSQRLLGGILDVQPREEGTREVAGEARLRDIGLSGGQHPGEQHVGSADGAAPFVATGDGGAAVRGRHGDRSVARFAGRAGSGPRGGFRGGQASRRTEQADVDEGRATATRVVPRFSARSGCPVSDGVGEDEANLFPVAAQRHKDFAGQGLLTPRLGRF